MSGGCEQEIGLSDSFAKLKNELALWAKLRRFPLSATFELTPLCNLRCPMCYVRLDNPGLAKRGRLLSAAEWLEIARQSGEMGTLNVILTGGEPFLHPEFWEIYRGLRELGMLVVIYTNGCLINEETVAKLKEDPPFNIKISLYGASDETYAAMCGDPHGFTRVSRGIELLQEAGIPFYCTTTIVRENRGDIYAMAKYMYDKRVRFVLSSGVTLAGREGLSDPAASRLSVAEEGWKLSGLEKEKHKPADKPFDACGGYGTFYHMGWQGHLSYCAYAPKPYVKVGAPVRLQECWERLLELTDAIRFPPECAECEHVAFCRRCPGLLAAESGDPERASESFCSQAAEKHRLYDELAAKETEKQGENHL